MRTVAIEKYFNSLPTGEWHFFNIVDNQGQIYYVNFTPKESPLKEKEAWFLQGNKNTFHSLQELIKNTVLPKETESLIRDRLIKEVL